MLLTDSARQLLNLGTGSAGRDRTGRQVRSNSARGALVAGAYRLYDEAGQLVGTILHCSSRPRVGQNEETVYIRREG